MITKLIEKYWARFRVERRTTVEIILRMEKTNLFSLRGCCDSFKDDVERMDRCELSKLKI